MANPISSPSAERIPLHSSAARPVVFVLTGIYALGTVSVVGAIFTGEVMGRVLGAFFVVIGGLMVGRMWNLFRRVYMTREGLELTRPRRVVPWSQVGDAFRYPLSGPVLPICCIGINDAQNWDLRFFGRDNFDRVVRDGRARWASAREGGCP